MPLAQLSEQMRDPSVLVAYGIVILLALGLHEFAHAKFADMAGDPTPRYFGRVTLNLFNHFDPFGTIMIIVTIMTGFGIGWGKPVPMDPSKMRNPRWDHFVAVLAGPVSNFLQAVLYALLLRLVLLGAPQLIAIPFVKTLLIVGILTNLGLCFFNLIPLGPLDGMWVLGTFLGDRSRLQWTRWNLTIGQYLFLGLVLLGQVANFPILRMIIGPPIYFMLRLLTGLDPNL